MSQLVIPMAGLGQRFIEAGYRLPKPLIPVGGIPMVVRVVKNLPQVDRVIFICHPEHISKYPMWDALETSVPNSIIVIAPGTTQGQACSTALSLKYLDPDSPVLVAACDSTQLYDSLRWYRMSTDPTIDSIVWTFRDDPRVLARPQAWGWVDQYQGRVQKISVKKSLSEMPMNDLAITGTFWFRTAQLMAQGIEGIIANDRRINNEFYLDSVPNIYIEAGRKVMSFEVEKYIGWGTPNDYEDYVRWEQHFANRWAA